MLEELKKAAQKVVGVKQTRKAVLSGHTESVYVARDAESRVYHPVTSACEQMGLSVIWTDSMAELGAACGIEVGASVAAVLKAPQTV